MSQVLAKQVYKKIRGGKMALEKIKTKEIKVVLLLKVQKSGILTMLLSDSKTILALN
jgi:predicted regulator of Ras-like GTPase activity (Roadblock/LC7/MglB family)